MRTLRPLLPFLLATALAAPSTRADEPIEQTLSRLDRSIAAAPLDADLWLRRADLERRRGRYEASDAAVARAAELGADAGVVARERGRTASAAGRWVDAERWLRAARDVAPDDPGILVAHARALVALGRRRDAADTYAKVVRIAPRVGPDVHLERVRALEGSDDASIDAALRAAEEGIAALGPVPALEQAALDLEVRSGRTDVALARLDAMGARHSRVTLWIRRGEILEGAGRLEEAAAAYAAALAALESQPATRRATPAARDAAAHAHAGMTRVSARREEVAP